ncbi:hypothetical protein M434DRAFT_395624 [Hypoxylon sp. CO27-5]|nr:hypothetical protein M434DRAFT_395624 [Hypoxylon sp. CO27-5]
MIPSAVFIYNYQSTKDKNGETLNKDSSKAKPEDSVEPSNPVKTEESAKPKQRVHWNDEAILILLVLYCPIIVK